MRNGGGKVVAQFEASLTYHPDLRSGELTTKLTVVDSNAGQNSATTVVRFSETHGVNIDRQSAEGDGGDRFDKYARPKIRLALSRVLVGLAVKSQIDLTLSTIAFGGFRVGVASAEQIAGIPDLLDEQFGDLIDAAARHFQKAKKDAQKIEALETFLAAVFSSPTDDQPGKAG